MAKPAKKKPATEKVTLQTLSDRLVDIEEKIDRLIHNVQGIKVVEVVDDDEDDEEEEENELFFLIRTKAPNKPGLKMKASVKYLAGYVENDVSDHGVQIQENWTRDKASAFRFPTGEAARLIRKKIDPPHGPWTDPEVIEVRESELEDGDDF